MSSLTVSEILKVVPTISAEYVFADREVTDAAAAWLVEKKDDIIKLSAKRGPVG